LNEAAERFRSSGKATRAILDVSSGASLRDDGPKELIDDRGKLHGSVQGLLPFKEIGVMLCGFHDQRLPVKNLEGFAVFADSLRQRDISEFPQDCSSVIDDSSLPW